MRQRTSGRGEQLGSPLAQNVTPALGGTTSLEKLNQKLKEQNLIGYWTIPNTSTGFREPEPSYRPFLWKWPEIRLALDQAAEFIRPEDAFRRFIGYQHPELKLGTAHTLLMARRRRRAAADGTRRFDHDSKLDLARSYQPRRHADHLARRSRRTDVALLPSRIRQSVS